MKIFLRFLLVAAHIVASVATCFLAIGLVIWFGGTLCAQIEETSQVVSIVLAIPVAFAAIGAGMGAKVGFGKVFGPQLDKI